MLTKKLQKKCLDLTSASMSTYDRSAVMKAAHREYKYAKSKGWTTGRDPVTFASCLRIAHGAHRAYCQRAVFTEQRLRLVA